MLRPMELKAASASDTVSWGPGKLLTSRIRDTRPSLRPVGNAMKGPPDCETTRVPQYYDQFQQLCWNTKELLDDSLWENCLTLPSRIDVKTQVTGNCATQGVLQTFPGSFIGKVQLSHLEGYCEPMSKWKLVNFSMVGKPLLGETNFPFDISGSKRDL